MMIQIMGNNIALRLCLKALSKERKYHKVLIKEKISNCLNNMILFTK